MIKVITSKENKSVKFALSLKENKYRKESKKFLAETKKTLEMALRENLVCEIFTTEWLDVPENIPQNLVSEEILKKLSNNVNPEGVVFIAKERETFPENPEKILYLDHVQDPGNMGTLIRTALAFNYDLVVASDDSVSFYNEKVINSSKGAIFAMPTKKGNLNEYKKDYEIIVSALTDDAVELDKIKFNNKFVLVLGNESNGVSKESLTTANKKVIIPIQNIDSLNVAVAGGILMNKIH